jgi:hypothetical protein
MELRLLTTGLALAVALGAASFASGANAKPEQIDPSKVQALAGSIETALAGLSCTAPATQEDIRKDIETIQSTIAGSGASPREAQAALALVQSSQGLCGTAGVAVASVNERITVALEGSGPAAGPGGGPGGGSPIGSPPAYVGGGGSNYKTQ